MHWLSALVPVKARAVSEGGVASGGIGVNGPEAGFGRRSVSTDSSVGIFWSLSRSRDTYPLSESWRAGGVRETQLLSPGGSAMRRPYMLSIDSPTFGLRIISDERSVEIKFLGITSTCYLSCRSFSGPHL
jgi:hypothetical protein